MEAGGLFHLWTEWGILILVLVSFALQVLLILLGWLRWRGLYTWQKTLLWFVYHAANCIAAFGLGHLGLISSREHRLVAFWAPFLLLHLGGPHNLNAFALEENRRWLSDLLGNLGPQVTGAAYVLYKYKADTSTLLQLASISMFVAGIAKCSERIWALKCANNGSSSGQSREKVYPYKLLKEGMGDDEILLRAHSLFAICKSCFNDTDVHLVPTKRDLGVLCKPIPFYEEDTFKLLEMELSLMYDTVYTKAAAIHTWYGFFLHFISLVGTSAAFCLFHLSIAGGRGNEYAMLDVVVSYVLLTGALALEVISACTAVWSSWTCSLILRWTDECRRRRSSQPEYYYYYRLSACLVWLHYYVFSLPRKLLKPANRRRWHNTVGQYNLLHFSTRDKTSIVSKLAVKVGYEDWWNKLHFSGAFSGSETLSMQKFKDFLFENMRREQFGDRMAHYGILQTKGRFILERKEAFSGVAQWTLLNIMFDESIVIWHIATELLLIWWESEAVHDVKLVEATRVLSNYMMFLLVAKPHMLPCRERRIHLEPSAELEGTWRYNDFGRRDETVSAIPRSWNEWCCILKELMHQEGPNWSTITQTQKEVFVDSLSGIWSHKKSQQYDEYPELLEEYIRKLNPIAIFLAKQLFNLGRTDMLEVIFLVWVEMMVYAAENCPRESHARELANGGELATIVWLLVRHWIYTFKHVNVAYFQKYI